MSRGLEMNNYNTICQLLPEFKELFLIRYDILKQIKESNLIGRRQISKKLSLQERKVRNEVDNLVNLDLVVQYNNGVSITQKGNELINTLYDVYMKLDDLNILSNKLKNILDISEVMVLNSKSFEFDSSKVLLDMLNKFSDKKIIGITGGSSVGLTISSIPENTCVGDFTVVSARGSIGNNSINLSNTIVETFARKTSNKYYPLYTPDILSEKTIDALRSEIGIKESIVMLNKVDTLIFGIGRADEMGKRRNLEPDFISNILNKGAKAEAFGYYFNSQGEIVDFINTVGIDINHFKKINNLIAIAYSKKKADAIVAVSKVNSRMKLITDDECARQIIKNLGGKYD